MEYHFSAPMFIKGSPSPNIYRQTSKTYLEDMQTDIKFANNVSCQFGSEDQLRSKPGNIIARLGLMPSWVRRRDQNREEIISIKWHFWIEGRNMKKLQIDIFLRGKIWRKKWHEYDEKYERNLVGGELAKWTNSRFRWDGGYIGKKTMGGGGGILVELIL